MASKLFTPGQIGTLTLPNRLIRSATQDPFGHRDGTCDEKQVSLYQRFEKFKSTYENYLKENVEKAANGETATQTYELFVQ